MFITHSRKRVGGGGGGGFRDGLPLSITMGKIFRAKYMTTLIYFEGLNIKRIYIFLREILV